MTPVAETDDHQVCELSRAADATLVIITFNAPELTEWQLYGLDRHFGDSKLVIIADNSTDARARMRIRSLAHEYGAVYRGLPSPPRTTPSYSHGLALNYSYRNLLRATQSTYIAFLDHDIFPIRSVSYKEQVVQYRSLGRVMRHGDYS